MRRCLPVALVLAMVLAGIRAAAAQPIAQPAIRPVADASSEPTAAGSSDILRFRRVLVPAASREDWPLGQQRYLPIAPEEFEKLLSATTAPTANRSVIAPRIAQAEYTARLEGDRLIEGSGTLWVEHASETRSLLRLDSCGLALNRAFWADEEPRPAVLGLGVGNALDLLVEQTGRLLVGWSLAGRRDSTSGLTFSLRFPACPVNRLLLETGDGVGVSVDHGTVLDAELGDDGVRRWRIELGNRFECELRIVPLDDETTKQGLSLLREQTTYDVSLRGIEVAGEWNLEIHHEPLNEIILLVDAPLQLATANLGEEPLPWTTTPGQDGGPSRVVLRLPRPVQGTGLVLRLGALAPLGMDRACRLPRMRPEGIFWQEGGALLFVQTPLVVQRLSLVGCRQTGVEFVSTPRKGEAFQLQFFHPEATAKLELVEPKHQVDVVSGTSVQWGEEELRATIRANVRLKTGSQFHIGAAVAPRWMIDTVESAPADAVDEWAVEADEQGRRRLVVRLARSLSADTPVRLSVSARRLAVSLGDSLRADDLTPLRFEATETRKCLMSLRTSEAFEVELAGSSASVRSRDAMPPADAELLDADEAATFLQLDAAAPSFEARLTPRRPRFAAQVDVEARVAQKVLEERYAIRCRPESARLDRVVVWLSRQREERLLWGVDDDDAARVAAYRWTTNEQLAAGLPAEGETWELRLNPPATEPVTLSARRRSAFVDEAVPSLASAPDAEMQAGLLVIHAEPGTSIQLDNRRLSSLPVEPSPPDGFATTLAAYRYDPWREVGRSVEPPVVISPRAAEHGALALIWRATLESRFDSAGMGTHVAEFLVENLGLDAIRIRLPADMLGDGPVEVWVDQQRVAAYRRPVSTADGGSERLAPSDAQAAIDGALDVWLPAGKRYPTISLAFTSHGSRLSKVGSILAPWPELNVAVLTRSWSVWLPSEYATYGHADEGSPLTRNWSQRLLGPLDGSAGRKVFNPLTLADWSRLFGMAPPPADAWAPEPDQLSTPSAPSPNGLVTRGRLALPDATGLASPWLTRDTRETRSRGPIGWREVTSTADSGHSVVQYYHEHTLRLAGALAFLLSISGGWWLARNHTLTLLCAACCAGLFALSMPEPYVFTATGVVLGSLFCLVFRLVHRRASARVDRCRRRAEVASPPSTVSLAIPWSLVLLAGAFAPFWATPARGEEAAGASATPMYRVIIPVDGEKKPVGGKYFLPERLFAELHRLAAAQRELPQGWLLGKAVYRGDLVREPVGDRFLVEQIRAQFDLHVFGAATRVQIPLERTGANLLPDGVSLDGQAVQVEWSEDNRALVFEVAEPGQYVLELRMRPRMRSEPPSGFELSIPATLMAQLELTLPSAAPTVEAPTARGDVRRLDGPSRFIAELGPSDQISVRWQSGGTVAGSGPAVDVEELLWMKVQPGSVLIEARWKLAVVEGRVRRFRLAIDPRMRLLPLEGSRSPAVRTSVGDNELLQLELEWPEPLQDKTVVAARFLLTGTSGVGNLRMPQIDILDGRMTRRWMAVSVADALQFEQGGGEQLAPVPIPEFLAAWGETDYAPSFAHRLSTGTPDWSLATRPRESAIAVASSIAMRFAEDATEVEYDAKLDTNTGYRFHYAIAGPKNLEIARVSLFSDDVDRAVRWSQDPSGEINLFLAGPVSGSQRLVLSGRLPAAIGRPLPIPAFHLQGGQQGDCSLHLLRKPGVLVELHEEGSLTPTTPRAAEAASESKSEAAGSVDWLPIGSYRIASSADATASALAVVNHPKVAGKEIVRLSVHEGIWHARWECRFEISDGFLEDVAIAAPATWIAPFQASRNTTIRDEPTGEARRELRIRPEQPAKGRWWTWVSGQLRTAAGERVSVPDIAVKEIRGIDRFVILPRRVDGIAMDWQVQGLQSVSLAQVAPELAPEQRSLAAFRVVKRSFSAELSESATPPSEGRVHLAEYIVDWSEDAAVGGIARFHVEPGTRQQCEVRFPAGSRPLMLKVDGRLSPLTGLSDADTLRVTLGPPGIPQRMDVVFEASATQPSRRQLDLVAPAITAMPVDKTLWTVAIPVGRAVGALNPDEESTGWQLALVRLESLGTIIERASSSPTNGNAAELTGWRRHWLRLWAKTRNVAANEIDRIREADIRRHATESLAAIVKRHAEAFRTLDEGWNADNLLPSSESEDDAFDARRAAFPHSRDIVYGRMDRNAPAISVELASAPAQPWVGRAGAGMAWIALLGTIAIALRRGLLLEWYRRWPQTVGVLAGLGWWLWLSPSILGLVLVVACVAASARNGWRSVSQPLPDGSVISVSRR